MASRTNQIGDTPRSLFKPWVSARRYRPRERAKMDLRRANRTLQRRQQQQLHHANAAITIIQQQTVNSTTVTSNCTNIVRNSNHRNHARDDDDGDGHDDDGRQYQEEVSGASLHAEEPSEFRALAARANYLAQDRPDIQYAVKEVARRMSVPTDTRPAQTSGTILGAGLLEVFCTTASKASQTRSKSSQTRTGRAARPRRGVQAEEWHEQAGIHERRGVLRRR